MEVLTVKKPIIMFLILIFAVNAFGYTSSARRYMQSSRSARQVYNDNRALEGRTSDAIKFQRNYNEEHHLGPSPLLYPPFLRYKHFDRDEEIDHDGHRLYMNDSEE
jgi:hypothetical protein